MRILCSAPYRFCSVCWSPCYVALSQVTKFRVLARRARSSHQKHLREMKAELQRFLSKALWPVNAANVVVVAPIVLEALDLTAN